MHEVQVPLELKPVFNKRGSDWTPKEKDQVLNWLYKHQQTYLLILALRYLRRYNTRGGYATPEDAEDAFQDLFAKKWEGILRNYDPAKGDNDRQEERYCRFWTYLKTCLKRVCIDLKIGEPFPIGHDLRLMSVAAVDGLGEKGRKLVIVALVGTDLHIRIFDASGKKVVDKAESELVSGIRLTALKKRLNSIPDESALSNEQKQNIIEDATSIAGHARTIVTRYEHEVPLLKPEDDEGEPTVYEVVGKDDPGKPIAEEEGEFVKECLRRVKKTSREVIEMHYVRDMCHEEIAEELGISIGYARLKLHKALQELRTWMTKYLPRLGPKYREIVEMYMRNIPHKKIAEELGISETSANVRLANAWRELLDYLREERFA